MLSISLAAEQDQRISEVFERERTRLRNFIRKRVADAADAEDILQDVFYEFVAAARMMETIEQASAWLFRVARNRIIDRFRKKRAVTFTEAETSREESARLNLEELLPSPDAGPDAAYARGVLIEELEAAMEELPAEQREAFVAHEIEGRSFKELSAETGVSVNALILRKHYAVLRLRQRLQSIYEDFSKR